MTGWLESALAHLRGEGWTVAVHNDYRLNGEPHTFWLFVRNSTCSKGEGRTDRDAVNCVLADLIGRGDIDDLPAEPPSPSEIADAVRRDIIAELREKAEYNRQLGVTIYADRNARSVAINREVAAEFDALADSLERRDGYVPALRTEPTP